MSAVSPPWALALVAPREGPRMPSHQDLKFEEEAFVGEALATDIHCEPRFLLTR